MAAPPFSLPHPAPHSPHVSTAAWPNIYAIAIAAIGQVIPYRGSLPVPAAWMRRGLFVYWARYYTPRIQLVSAISVYVERNPVSLDKISWGV